MSRTRKTPQQIAERHISEWHASLVDGLPEDFDTAVEDVTETLKREHKRAHHGDSEDAEIYLRAQAGYLIGLQVGLRLRPAGGGR